MKKGFTLIELLAVIMILGILLLVVVPKALDIVQNSRNNTYDEQIERIEAAAALYVSGEPFDIIFVDDEAVITLQDIIDGGYIEPPVINPKTDQAFDTVNTIITITKNENQYTYVVTPVD